MAGELDVINDSVITDDLVNLDDNPQKRDISYLKNIINYKNYINRQLQEKKYFMGDNKGFMTNSLPLSHQPDVNVNVNNKSTKFTKSSGTVPNDLAVANTPASTKSYSGVNNKKQDDKETFVSA